MTHRPDLAGLVTDNIIARARVIHAQRETAAAAGEPARALTLDDLEAVTVECSTGTRRDRQPPLTALEGRAVVVLWASGLFDTGDIASLLHASDADVHRLVAAARDLANGDAA